MQHMYNIIYIISDVVMNLSLCLINVKQSSVNPSAVMIT